MSQFGASMGPFTSSRDGAPQRPQSQSQPQQANAGGGGKPPAALPIKAPHNGVADVKPRLTKDQHDVLESHFLQQHKPSTAVKKGFAEALGVPVDKINNWFQNRRAKVKQDMKKSLNQMNMGMNMGMYSQPQMGQMGMVANPYGPHVAEAPHAPMQPDFYVANADISPRCLPVQGMDGPSALDLGSQMPLQPYDIHLRSIPETDRGPAYHPVDVFQNFMAATVGPSSFMQNPASSLPPQIPNFNFNGLPNSYPSDLGFSVPHSLPNESVPAQEPLGEFPDFSQWQSSSASEAQNVLGSISIDTSPYSGSQTIVPTRSSAGANPEIQSIASAYSNWSPEDQKPLQDVHQSVEAEDHFSYNMPQAAMSDQAFMNVNGTWNMFQHQNASAQAILPSPEQADDQKLDPPPTFQDDIYSRRNSSTTNLANNIEAIHIQGGHTPDGFRHPEQPLSIAARRHKRPTALNQNTLRSASYTSGMSSPGANGDHTLRRIRSGGVINPSGRVQKPSSAQRSPMNPSFPLSDATASPKFARTFSESSTAHGGSLAPPTPLTPNETSRFGSWQGNAAMKFNGTMDHSSPESLNANWTNDASATGIYSTGNSPPSTPFDPNQLNQVRLANESLYRDTPPQSAPATQPGFPGNPFMPTAQLRAGFHSSTDLTLAQPKPSHFRRPSLPGNDMDQYPAHQPGTSFEDRYGDLSLQGIHHNVPFAPPSGFMPDLCVQEYNRPPGSVAPSLFRRTTEPQQQKSYIFANQGPGDFRPS